MDEEILDWLDVNRPEMEDAVLKLLQMIRLDAPRSEMLIISEYIGEFWQDNDPRSMGLVDSNGRP